jgi:hypothetical protein
LSAFSNPNDRSERHRQQHERVSAILANQPTTNVWKLNVSGNEGIGDAGMIHLHLLPDSVTYLGLGLCGLTPIGIKRLCKFLKTNKSITAMVMRGNRMGSEGVKHVADMMKVNNTISYLGISSCQISAADCCPLSEGLALNTGLREFYIGDEDRLTDGHVQNLCPGLARNKGLETIGLFCPPGSITETGVGRLEKVLRTNVYLKSVTIGRGNCIPTGPRTIWNKMMYWLYLNKSNRKLIQDCTPTQWRDAIIHSAEAGNPDAIFMFLTNKPDLCTAV